MDNHLNKHQTKKMLNVLRKTSFSGVIKEQTEAPTIDKQDTDISVINDVDIKLTSEDKLDLKISDKEKDAWNVAVVAADA